MKHTFPILAISATTVFASLEVRLTHLEGTTVRASITNTDTRGYNLLSRGSIFDSGAVRKLHVKNESHDAPFHGITKQGCSHGDLSQADFTPIASKQTIDHDIDVSDIYGLDAGNWHVSTKYLIPYAEEDSFELSGESLPFLSNQLLLALDASHDTHRTKHKRTTMQSDCSGEQNSAVVNANKECARMANAAAQEAESGSEDTFNTFFKTTSESARKQVAEGFRKVADECATTPGGTSTSSCTDPKRMCSGNLLAYTFWMEQEGNTEGQTYYCPRYFNDLPATGEQCGYQNQGSTTLHEMTHALLSTEDITYGLENCKSLSSSQALVNADSYTFYAIAVALKCDNNDDSPSQYGQGGDSSPSEYGQPAQPEQPEQPEQPTQPTQPSTSDANNDKGDDSSATPKTGGHLWSWFSSWFNVTSNSTSAR